MNQATKEVMNHQRLFVNERTRGGSRGRRLHGARFIAGLRKIAIDLADSRECMSGVVPIPFCPGADNRQSGLRSGRLFR